MISLADLRRFAVARSLFTPTTLERAINRLGFVQADPIRAPARAQDLTLRHRVRNYHAGDLELRYAQLGIEEDFFVNYGFMPTAVNALMHPRVVPRGWSPWGRAAGQQAKAKALYEFVRERGDAHPRDVDAHFSHGRVTNYWGGSSSATTHWLQHMHYSGMLRVTRREEGIRIYNLRPSGDLSPLDVDARLDALVDVAVNVYAPLPEASLVVLVRRLRWGAPQWQKAIPGALKRAKERLAQARVGEDDWYWPADERLTSPTPPDAVRLLAPFDPVVWDRRRFELLWGWAYRFEAYTPVTKRKLGYYALPLLWRDRVIGWGNLSAKNGQLQSDFGYVASRPREHLFRRELDAELDRVRTFLSAEP